ncbi:MAG: hypothetical protein ISQ14_00515 [Verrucomicrobiae bacterium]|jgi:hypothetical protein|nr:hypothetical protein [Verrucomicrobiae bacterium]
MNDESITAESLIRELREMSGERCPHCDGVVSAVDALKSRALGARRRPRCLEGLAQYIGSEVEDLQRQLADYFSQRECYQGALNWAEQQDAE